MAPREKPFLKFTYFDFFLDRARVLDATTERARRAMVRLGGFIRTVARRSMRPGGKGQKVSQPGEPPRHHTRLLKDLIFFAFDFSRDTVVIGPVRLHSKRSSKPIRHTVPGVLEFGGDIRIDGKVVHIEPRPYMGPALNRALREDKLRRFWEQIA